MKRPVIPLPGPAGIDKSRRGLWATGWILPGTVLLLMPKCPACVAAWIAIGTGLGVSLSTAATLRTGLLILSAGLLALFAVKGTCRLVRRSASAVKNSDP